MCDHCITRTGRNGCLPCAGRARSLQRSLHVCMFLTCLTRQFALLQLAVVQLPTSDIHLRIRSALRQSQVCLRSRSPWQKGRASSNRMATSSSPGTVEQEQIRSFCNAVKQYAALNSKVHGTTRLLKRAQRDLTAVTALVESNKGLSSNELDSRRSIVNTALLAGALASLQGTRNNLRGMQAELDVAEQAPDVVCLGARFYSQVMAGMTMNTALSCAVARPPCS